MVVQAPAELLCDEQEEVARSSVVQRLDKYRLRIASSQDEATRDLAHHAIAQEISADHSGLGACASAILNSRICPPIGGDAWETLVAVRDSTRDLSSPKVHVVESAICLRLIAQVTAHWGAQIVEHYGWIARGRVFLDRLWAVAELIPAWDAAARHLGVVLLFRHELVLMGRTSGAARSWQTVGNEAEKGNPRLSFSPITSADLKNAVDWIQIGSLDMSDFSLHALRDAESRVSHWTSSTTDTICLLDGSRLSDRPPAVQNSAMLARDKFGLLVREDSLRRRPRRSPADLLPPAKRLRRDSDSSQLSDLDEGEGGPSSPEEGSASSLADEEDGHDGSGSSQSTAQASPHRYMSPEANAAEQLASLPSTAISSFIPDLFQDAEITAQSHYLPFGQVDWPALMGGTSLYDEHGKAQQPTPSTDAGRDARGGTSSTSTPASIDGDDGISHASSSWTSVEPDEDTMGPRSSDCPVCGGMCTTGLVPREIVSTVEDRVPSVERSRQFVEMHEIAGLLQERQETDPKAGVQRAWAASLQMASVYIEPDPANLSTASRDDADLWCLDSQHLRQYSESGISLDRPIIVRNAVRDAGWHSTGTCVATMRRKVDGQSLQVRDPIADRIIDMDGDDFLDSLSNPQSALDALDLPAFVRGDKPEFTLLPRYRLLEDLALTKAWDYATEQTPPSELDLTGFTQFNLASGRGAFSGAHLECLNGTWVRNFAGRKACMFVPQRLFTAADFERFSRDGDDWHPRGKARTVVLRPDDVFFMPPGYNIVHAVLTLEACVMEGAKVWDERCTTRILRNMYWIANNQNATSEPWPNNIQAIIARLDQAVFADPDRFWPQGEIIGQLEQYKTASAALQSLPCACAMRCTKSCPCRIARRRCTVECKQHEARKLVCKKGM